MAVSVSVYRRLFRYLRPYKRRFVAALLAMAVYGATDGAVPYLLKRILDDVFGSQNLFMLKALVVAIVVFAVVRGVFGFLEKYLEATVGLFVVQDMRNEINWKLLSLPRSFFDKHTTGNLISRVTNDTLLVRSALTDAAASLLRDVIRVVALLAVAFYLDATLALIAFVAFPLGLMPVLKFGKKVRKLSRMGQNQFGGLTSLLQETIIGHNVVAAFGREDYEQERFKAENGKFTQIFTKAEKYGALSGPTNEVLASLAIAGIILYGGLSVINGVRTQGDFVAFITALFLLYEPLKKISRINNTIQTGVSAAERIFEILDTESDIVDSLEAKPLSVRAPQISYEGVWFAYPRETEGLEGAFSEDSVQWAVRNISLEIKAGEMVALVGMSGGGKSTVVNLLPRFYDPQRGAIRINGTDIRELTLASLRQHIALVNQHTFLFNDTVFNNIAYGRTGASLDEVKRVASAANADIFISRLPEGYNTVVGEQGLMLSGGERARIAIARALLKDAPILILDEATASLDSESEGLVQEAVDRLMRGRTTLVIAHRLATIRNADKIAVVVHGRLVELGTHDELYAAGGEYAKLYRLQFKDPAVNATACAG
jgi:subfamily B ATP-binding cassette protein MsbA